MPRCVVVDAELIEEGSGAGAGEADLGAAAAVPLLIRGNNAPPPPMLNTVPSDLAVGSMLFPNRPNDTGIPSLRNIESTSDVVEVVVARAATVGFLLLSLVLSKSPLLLL